MDYNRRAAARRRVLKAGTIEFGAKNMNALPCTVRDFSASGAKLQVDSPLWFPETFLLSSGETERRPCRVVWRDGRRIGVVFTDAASEAA